jgi:aminoglycoside phosphotransferase (APT) family kinase protein
VVTPAPGVDPALVDLDVLAAWMDAQGLPRGPITDAELLAGGTQNVLVRFSRGGRSYVLRRPPPHLRPSSNEVLRRESRVLAALAGTDVPHPRFVAACPDETVMRGAVFYLMEPVDGFSPATGLPPLHAGEPAIRHAMGLAAAEALTRLHGVDHVAVGLADFGKPEGFLERQVPRWMSELESYARHDGYPGPDIPGLDRVAAWLDRNRPRRWTPGILHGDYHLANVMYAHDGPRLAAIVDWEMCTIGDPLLDLGWLVATWPDPEQPGPTAALASMGGFPTTDEVVAHYADRSARDCAAIDWYVVLACFKLGIVLEGTHARACAGKAPTSTGDLLHAITLGLFARALAIIGGD